MKGVERIDTYFSTKLFSWRSVLEKLRGILERAHHFGYLIGNHKFETSSENEDLLFVNAGRQAFTTVVSVIC